MMNVHVHDAMLDPLLLHLHAIHTNRYDIALTRSVWTADRYQPVALPWLTRWDPADLVAEEAPLPVCTCDTGRCGTCN